MISVLISWSNSNILYCRHIQKKNTEKKNKSSIKLTRSQQVKKAHLSVIELEQLNSFEEVVQRLQAVVNTASNLIGAVIKHTTSRSNQPAGRAVTRSSLKREVWGLNLDPVTSNRVLPTARHRCDNSSKEAVLAGRNDAEMGPANSLHASA